MKLNIRSLSFIRAPEYNHQAVSSLRTRLQEKPQICGEKILTAKDAKSDRQARKETDSLHP